MRALVSAKEQGNAAFKERRWGDAHRHYSDALARYAAGTGNEAFFAQCYSNRCVSGFMAERKEPARLKDRGFWCCAYQACMTSRSFLHQRACNIKQTESITSPGRFLQVACLG